jgi:GLPGLI family protein
MKYNLIISILALTISNVFCQKKGIVNYGQIESKRLKGPYGPDFNAYLVFNNNESLYVTAKDSLDSETEFQKRYSNSNGQNIISFSVMTTQNGRQVYYNKQKDSLFWNQWVNFYVAEKRPVIDWQLNEETKEIGKFTAHKATGKFRGRIYTAWYILEIPLPYGPWKLQGLPGLILEAYDKDKEMYLYFKSIEYPTTNKTAITQIKRLENHPKNWKTLQDFKNRLDKIYAKMKNSSITIAERLNTNVPEQKIKSEVFIESFK